MIGEMVDAEAVKTMNLHQRLLAIAQQVGLVTPSGKNQYKAVALSIGDVENELRPYFASFRIITRWSHEHVEDIGEGKLWLVHYRVTVTNADEPTDQIEDQVMDIGGNPAAAGSFARKAYYKALFHLASDTEESDRNEVQTSYNQRRSAPQSSKNHASSGPDEQDTLPTGFAKASPYKPASANQMATIAKLKRLINESGEVSEDMTSADASEEITRLSRVYNEQKGQAAATYRR